MGSPPTAAVRATPDGNMLENGYQCLVALTGHLDIDFWEKTVTPPGVEGGDPIDVTTQHNSTLMTKHPQALYDLTDGQITVAYARPVYSQIIAIVNVPLTITYLFQDGGTVAVYGYLRSFTPAGMANGTFPEATIVLVHTNLDPSDHTEQAMVVSAPVGTP